MNRLFSILLSLFLLFLVYLWINHITKGNTVGTLTKTEHIADQKPLSQRTDTRTKPVEDTEVVVEKPEAKSSPKEETKPKVEQPATPKKKTSATTSGGAHMVVAGNFLERTNAEKHLKTIKGLGYPYAEILNFEISEYYTVLAGRYDNLTEAKRVAKSLKDKHSIDTYVRYGN